MCIDYVTKKSQLTCLTYPHKQFLFGYPVEAHQVVRDLVGELTGLGINSRSKNITLFVYEPDTIIVENFNDDESETEINLPLNFVRDKKVMQDVLSGEELILKRKEEGYTVTISIPSRSYRIFSI